MKSKRVIASILSALFLISSVSTVSAQKVSGYLALRGTVKVERENFAISKVKVYIDGSLEKIYDADKTGKFAFNVDLNKQVVLEFVRQGYYNKKLEFNTNVQVEDVSVYNYKFSIELLPEVDGFDASIFDNPIGKIKFVDKVGDFDYDAAYTTEIQKRIKAMMKDYDQKRAEMYDRLIEQADNQFGQANYEEAVELYEKASSVDPYQTYPEDQIMAIKRILAKNQNNEKNYQKNIAIADNAFNTQQYTNAQIYYKRALTYKDDQYPKNQLYKIDEILSEMNDASAALAAKEKAYREAIEQADRNYQSKNYEQALTKYVEASGIKPEEQYPKDKIAELDALIAAKNADAANKEAIEKAYRDAVTQADNLYNQSKLAEARAMYVKANEIKPAEAYPTTRISAIDKMLAANKANEDKYNGFITVADNSFSGKDYASAKSNYQQALTIKPNEAYPKQKIAEIDNILAQVAANKNAYNAAIAKADKLFKSSKWEDAKSGYEEALAIFPDEQYPKDRIAEIDSKLLALRSAAEKEQATSNAYNDYVRRADSLLNLKKYEDAKSAYNQALAIKAKESYPKQKIAEIDKLLDQQKALDAKYLNLISYADDLFNSEKYKDSRNSYTNASALKPDESYPKERIAEIDRLLAAQKVEAEQQAKNDEQYKSLISQADELYKAKNYAQAKSSYEQASALKPNELYPKQQIVTIDNLLAKMADIERQYAQAISNGDGLFAQKKYTEAITAYNQALTVKPDEKYPKDKIAEAQSIINAENQKQQQYTQLISQADNLFNQKSYTEAKGVYQQALQVMPNETHPQSRIQQIDVLLAEAAKLKAEQENQLRTYKAKIAEADRAFNSHNYDKAVELYNAAKAAKPDETYPDQQLAQISANIKTEHEQEAKAKVDADYRNAVTQADNAFKAKDYSSAIALYKSASAIKPEEKYPKSQIELCEQRLKENKALAEAEAERKRKEELAAAQDSYNKKNFDADAQISQRNEKFLNDLAKQYPEGITTENYDKPNKKIRRVIVNRGGIAHEYIEAKYSYGTFYFKDGRNISSQAFFKETK